MPSTFSCSYIARPYSHAPRLSKRPQSFDRQLATQRLRKIFHRHAALFVVAAQWLHTGLTTLHLFQEAEAAKLLGIPDGMSQVCLLPVAYTRGTDFKVASP